MSKLQEKEEAMIKAGEKLGELMSQAPEEKKVILKKILSAVEEFSTEREKQGVLIDKSSIYAAAIMLDEELKADENLMEAAKAYIDADYEYIKALKEENA